MSMLGTRGCLRRSGAPGTGARRPHAVGRTRYAPFDVLTKRGPQTHGRQAEESRHRGQHAQAQADAQAKAVADAQAAALAEAEHQLDQLNGRAASVKASLATLKNSMSQQGLGLRGDMVAAEARLDTDMQKAQQALDAQNPDRAKTYIKQADAEVEKLEKFMGH